MNADEKRKAVAEAYATSRQSGGAAIDMATGQLQTQTIIEADGSSRMATGDKLMDEATARARVANGSMTPTQYAAWDAASTAASEIYAKDGPLHDMTDLAVHARATAAPSPTLEDGTPDPAYAHNLIMWQISTSSAQNEEKLRTDPAGWAAGGGRLGKPG